MFGLCAAHPARQSACLYCCKAGTYASTSRAGVMYPISNHSMHILHLCVLVRTVVAPVCALNNTDAGHTLPALPHRQPQAPQPHPQNPSATTVLNAPAVCFCHCREPAAAGREQLTAGSTVSTAAAGRALAPGAAQLPPTAPPTP